VSRRFQFQVALAAIAAAQTFVAQVISARVFRAFNANSGRFLFANTAGERHVSRHWL
jgi:hypothetical protein